MLSLKLFKSKALRSVKIGQKRFSDIPPTNIRFPLPIFAAVGIGGYFLYDFITNDKGKKLLTSYGITNIIDDQLASIYDPYSTKLLPDFPTHPMYAGVPPGTPAPPLLVIDVESTLIGCEYNSKNGWRYVKRPGATRLIDSLQQYYEVVLLYSSELPEEVLLELDPKHSCHKFSSAEMELRDGVFYKRLDYMNRDIERIILLDGDETSSSLFPRNTLIVPPYSDLTDKRDSFLLDLIPFLQALCHHHTPDFRNTFDSLGTHNAVEAITEYQKRLFEKKQQEKVIRNKGIGGLLRGQTTLSGEAVTTTEDIMELSATRSKTSVLDLVGPSPIPLTAEDLASDSSSSSKKSSGAPSAEVSKMLPEKVTIGGTVVNLAKPSSNNNAAQAEKKSGAFLQWMESNQKMKAETEQRKMEKLNELYQKQQLEKKEQERKAKEMEERKRSFEAE